MAHKITKMNRFKIIIFLGIGSLLFHGCYYDNAEELYPNSTCNLSNLSYDLVIKPIIDANCAISGCHVSGTGRKDLSTYQGLKDVADDGRLHDRLVVKKDMPPSQPISNCDIAAIDAWINNGAPSQ